MVELTVAPLRAALLAASTLAWTGAASAPPSTASPQALRDTVVSAREGDRLRVQNFRGRLLVEGGDDAEVRLSGMDAGRVGLERRGGALAVVSARGGRRDVRVVVPRWMPVEISGPSVEAVIEGVATVAVRTADGDLRVRDVGRAELHTVDGTIDVERARGDVRARSVNDRVEVRDVTGGGEVTAESTDGDVVLVNVDAARVAARTVDGDVVFEGPLRPDGVYLLVTHDGDVTARIPRGTGAEVSISTFDGEFEASFPVVLERFQGGKEMTFTVGDGGPRLEIRAFDGDIRLEHR